MKLGLLLFTMGMEINMFMTTLLPSTIIIQSAMNLLPFIEITICKFYRILLYISDFSNNGITTSLVTLDKDNYRAGSEVPIIRSRLERITVTPTQTNYSPSSSKAPSYNIYRTPEPVTPQKSFETKSDQPTRSISPLPPSVSNRLKMGTYERAVKPCKSGMFRFFMEQHTEKLIQQWQERNQRALQVR